MITYKLDSNLGPKNSLLKLSSTAPFLPDFLNRGKWQHFLSKGIRFFFTFLLFSLSILSTKTFAQTCTPHCVSKDLQLVSATLVGSGPCTTCTEGTSAEYTLRLAIDNTTGSTRTSFAFFGNLQVTHNGTTTSTAIQGCSSGNSSDALPPNTVTELDFQKVSYTCGDVLKLTDLYLAWTSAADNKTCPIAFCDIDPKCGTLSSIVVTPPLNVKVTSSQNPCVGQSNGSITATATGGTPPYTYTLKKGTTTVASNSTGIFTGLSAGTYTVEVVDSKDCKITSLEKTLTDIVITAPTTSDVTICAAGNVTLTASGCSNGTLQFYAAATGGTPLSSPTVNVTANTTYYVSCKVGDCESDRSPIKITIAQISAPTTSDITICAPGNVTLTASGCSNGTLQFYAAASGGTPLSSATVNVTANTTYYVSCKVGNCESDRSPIKITITQISAPTTSDVTICAPGNVTLTASGCSNGTLQFYAAATGGTPLSSATVNVTANTTYYVSCKVGNCESDRSPIKITITPISAPTTSDVTICAPGNVTLTASGCSNGTLQFYAAATGGTPLSSATVNVTANTTYYVSCKVGNCESDRSPIKITITPISAPTTSDVTICAPGNVTLTASGCSNGTLQFYAAATGGTPLSSATVNVTANTTYYVSCKVGNCESDRSPIKITITPIGKPYVSCPVKYCGPAYVTLKATGCDGGTLYWYKEDGTFVGTGSPSIQVNTTSKFYVVCKIGDCVSEKVWLTIYIIVVEKPYVTCPVKYCGPAYVTLKATGCDGGTLYWYKEDGTFVGTGSPSVQVNTTSKFYVVCKIGDCVSEKVWVTIYIIVVEKPYVSCPVKYCGPAYVTLKATGCDGGTLYWYKEDGTFVGTGSPSVQVNTTSKFYVVCKIGDCVSEKVWVTIYIIVVEKPYVTCPVKYCGPAYVTLKATGCDGGTLYWYKEDGTFVGTGSPSVQVNTTSKFYVVCKIGDCVSEKVWVTIYIIVVEKPYVSCPVKYCGPAYVTLKATGCDGGTLYWYKEDGTFVGTGSPSVQVNTTSKFYVVCKIGDCVSEKVWVTIYIIVVEKPYVDCPVSYCGPSKVKLSAKGCDYGTLVWYKSDGSVLGTGSPLYVWVDKTTTFYVTCKKDKCESEKVKVVILINACTYCSYTQGFYHNKNGLALLPSLLTSDLVIGRSGYSLIIPKNTSTVKSAAKLNSILPGGSSPKVLKSGNCSIMDNCLSQYLTSQGRINNILLSQTITLSLNVRLKGGVLASFPIQSGYITTKEGGCVKINSNVVKYLTANGTKTATVTDLLNLANDVLGHKKTAGVSGVPSLSDINSAVDAINNAFDGCRTFTGYKSYCSYSITSSKATNGDEAEFADESENGGKPELSENEIKQIEVKAYPNPFTTTIRFVIKSPISGEANLDVFNVLGQRLQNVYKGHINAGVSQIVDYNVPPANRTNLIYKLNIGGRFVTGKVLKE